MKSNFCKTFFILISKLHHLAMQLSLCTLSLGILVQCQGTLLNTAQGSVETESIVRNSFLVTGHPSPISNYGSADSLNQEAAHHYLWKVRSALIRLDNKSVMQLFGDQAYTEPRNCDERMNNFIRRSTWCPGVGLIPGNDDITEIQDEMNRIRYRRSQVMGKMSDLIIALGRDIPVPSGYAP